MSQQKSSAKAVTFSGSGEYTLTGSLVASDVVRTDYANMVTIYAIYTPDASATGTLTLEFTVEVNPYDEQTDTTDAYWSPVGIYKDAAGTWTEEPGAYVSAAGTAATAQTITPLVLEEVNAAQLRIKAKDNASTAFGTVSFVIVKNNQ